ncbi:MAG TPA: L-threonylcarbamoyladenylate synthase [Ilumatobacter sp.]
MPSPADRLLTTDVGRALAAIRRGGVVAIPTETVYGLAADAEQPDAVGRIFAIKGRPSDHPLIVHLAGLDRLEGWAASIPEAAVRLAEACWPGPLTMLLPSGRRASPLVTGGRATVGIRVPSHPMTLDLLERHGGGLAAPSANRFGKVSPTTARHVLDDLAGLLDPERDVVLDGGPCTVGVESTIVDLTVDPPQVLRSGAISAADIERLLAAPTAPASGERRASGMLASHYAPDCKVVLAEDAATAGATAAAHRAQGERVGVLDRTDDPVAAAQLLYTDLREADRAGLDTLVVVLPAAEGIGIALRDRLAKAAAPTGNRRARSNRGG